MAGSRSLNVFVEIGAKVGSSVGASVRAVGNQLQGLTRRVQLANAEAKAASRGLMTSGDIRGAVFDSVAIGYGIGKLLEPAIRFESKMLDIKQLSDGLVTDTRAFGVEVQNLGRSFGYAGMEAADAVGAFLSVGFKVPDAMDAASASMRISRAAGADLADTNDAVLATMRNLKIAAKDIVPAFGQALVATREGRFELKDMAKELPRVAASASRAGIMGARGLALLSSQLQIVEEGTGDTNQAATNLQNFYDKIYAPVTRKKFEKLFSVDLTKLEKNAAGDGEKFVNSILDAMAKTSKNGKDQFAIGEIFEDVQARAAVVKLIQERGKVSDIYAKALAGTGEIDKAFGERSETALFRLQKARAALIDFQIKIGTVVIPRLNDLIDRFDVFMTKVDTFVQKNPKTVESLTNFAVALGGLLIVGKIGSIVYTGIARIAVAIRWVASMGRILLTAGPPIVAFFTSLAQIVAWGLGISVGAAIGLIAAALALLAAAIGWVVAKWDGIKTFFAGFADGFMKALGPEARGQIAAAGKALADFGSVIATPFQLAGKAIGWLVDKTKDLFAYIFGPPDTANWRSFGEQVGGWVGGVANSIANLIKLINDLKAAIANNLKLPDDWKARLQTGIRTGIGNVGGPGLSAGTAPGSSAGALAGQAISGRRALGGPMRRGGVYEINERGQELFAPGANGTMINARATAALMAAANNNAPRAANGGGDTYNFTINGAQDPQATAREVERIMKRYARGQRAALND